MTSKKYCVLLEQMIRRKYGYRRPTDEEKDKAPKLHMKHLSAELPKHVDLRPLLPPVVDQGELSSCVMNATQSMMLYMRRRSEPPETVLPLSRLMLYYNVRAARKGIYKDDGASIAETMNSLTQWGCCSEPVWPYELDQWCIRPPLECYLNASENMVLLWQTVAQNVVMIKRLHSMGLLVMFGMEVHPEFNDMAGKDCVLPMPHPASKPVGEHCVLSVGYDDSKYGGSLIVRNSYGEQWGDQGYFYLPYSYANDAKLCDEFTTMIALNGNKRTEEPKYLPSVRQMSLSPRKYTASQDSDLQYT